MVHRARSFNPALEQKGRTAADVAETMNDPRTPAQDQCGNTAICTGRDFTEIQRGNQAGFGLRENTELGGEGVCSDSGVISVKMNLLAICSRTESAGMKCDVE
jgi:hypothetical protein